MEIEDYSILGINIGKRDNKPQQNTGDDLTLLTGILGGMILGLSISQIFTPINDTLYRDNIKKVIQNLEEKANLKEKMLNIRQRIDSNNAVDIYGGILMLFSELEKFVDALYTKYIRGYGKPDTFKEKISELESRRTISSVESTILRNEIYPKRNLISHGRYQSVDKKDVLACYDFINQFINKYYSVLF
jgi:hypothetical protein